MNKSGMFLLKAQDMVPKSRDGTEMFSIKKEICFKKLAASSSVGACSSASVGSHRPT